MFNARFDWGEPYRWRTNLRILLPTFCGRFFRKGEDCEEAGGTHDWYNVDNVTSACYHCSQWRAQKLWPAASKSET